MTTSELLREAVQTIERLESFLNDGADIIDTSILQANLRQEADRLDGKESCEHVWGRIGDAGDSIVIGCTKCGMEAVSPCSYQLGKPKCRQCLHPEEKGICTCNGDPFDKYKPKPERLDGESQPKECEHRFDPKDGLVKYKQADGSWSSMQGNLLRTKPKPERLMISKEIEDLKITRRSLKNDNNGVIGTLLSHMISLAMAIQIDINDTLIRDYNERKGL